MHVDQLLFGRELKQSRQGNTDIFRRGCTKLDESVVGSACAVFDRRGEGLASFECHACHQVIRTIVGHCQVVTDVLDDADELVTDLFRPSRSLAIVQEDWIEVMFLNRPLARGFRKTPGVHERPMTQWTPGTVDGTGIKTHGFHTALK